jgi:predicted transcriptional regulator
MEKVNGVLAKALRDEIETQDLTIKEVANRIHRSSSVVFVVLRGEKVSRKTIRQIELAFPQVFA